MGVLRKPQDRDCRSYQADDGRTLGRDQQPKNELARPPIHDTIISRPNMMEIAVSVLLLAVLEKL